MSLGDIVIGYHKDDLGFVRRLNHKLTTDGLDVWYNQPEDGGKKTSEAILGCKVSDFPLLTNKHVLSYEENMTFSNLLDEEQAISLREAGLVYLPVVTESSVEDKDIHDQLFLAYTSNSAIYPLGRNSYEILFPKLNGGARLMLAKINWTFILKDEDFEKTMNDVIECIKKDLQTIDKNVEDDSGYVFTHGMHIPIRVNHVSSIEDEELDVDPLGQGIDLFFDSKDTPFWNKHFKGKSEVTWVEFKENFLNDYSQKIIEGFPDTHEKRIRLFIKLMYKDVFAWNDVIKHSVYDKFCGKSHPHAFFIGMQDYVMAYTSLREILSTDSGLRIPTIRNFEKFQYPVIVRGLSNLLNDEDPNIRSMAVIALARAGKKKSSTVDKIIGLLEDEDRLVRESACLSLGYLRSEKAVTHIVDRWRNDPISTVREAAELALSRMDAPDAVQCMKVTKVLTSEMNALKPKQY